MNDMGRQEPSEYLTRDEVMARLHVSASTIDHWTRDSLLLPVRINLNGHIHARYLREDVELLESSFTDSKDFVRVKFTALRALSAASRAEKRVSELSLSFGLPTLDLHRDDASIRVLAEELDTWIVEDLSKSVWVVHWTGVLFALDQHYLELVGAALADVEPWKRFIDFGSSVKQALDDLPERIPQGLAREYRHFDLARQHATHVGYLLCQQRHGGKMANRIFGGHQVTAVSEIEALLSR